jgi:osmotically-inducible protein OsmY
MAQERGRPRNDEDIKLDVVSNLRWDGRVDASSVQVGVEDGRVHLWGTVPNYTARAAARELTRLTAGVLGLEDDLEVEVKRTGPGEDDETLAARANDILQWHADLQGAEVRAEVNDRTLTLEGSMDEHWKSDRAEEFVQSIRGISEVKNNLAIVPTRTIADEALAEEITGALERNVLVDEDRVDVEVRNGIVTLSGRAASWLESSTIRDVVAATPGITEIRDNFHVDIQNHPV